MRLISWFSCALLGVASVLAYEAPTELKIDTTYSPSECATRASTGHHIEVHYVSDKFISRKNNYRMNVASQTGTLHKTGAKFDSR